MYTIHHTVHTYCTYLGLESTPKSDYERVLGKREDVPLIEHLLHLFLHDHTVLAYLLHCKPLSCGLVSYQVDSTGERNREGRREEERRREREREKGERGGAERKGRERRGRKRKGRRTDQPNQNSLMFAHMNRGCCFLRFYNNLLSSHFLHSAAFPPPAFPRRSDTSLTCRLRC